VQALRFTLAASFLSSGNFPVFKNWSTGVIQLSLLMSHMRKTSEVFSMLGFDRVSWMSD
ncbi:hypothetical protein A2U01_0088066, partial [Trifolium medium]|nr:hypothetical protein [Trifolium medium]